MVSFKLAASFLATTAGSASATLRSRRLSYEPIAGYEPGSVVTDENALDLDQAALESQLALGTSDSFAIAKKLYINGAHSRSMATLTLSSPLSIPLNATSAVGNNTAGSEVDGKIIEDYPAGTTEIQFLYKTNEIQSAYVGCQVGANPNPVTEGCLAANGTIAVGGQAFNYTYNIATGNVNGLTLQGLSLEAQEKMHECESCPYQTYEKFYKYYGVFDYANQWVLAAFDGKSTHFSRGNADFSMYSEAGREEAIKKGTAYMNVWMYAIYELEDALSECKPGCSHASSSSDGDSGDGDSADGDSADGDSADGDTDGDGDEAGDTDGDDYGESADGDSADGDSADGDSGDGDSGDGDSEDGGESSDDDSGDGKGSCNKESVSSWDKGAAFYSGSLEETDGTGQGVFPYSLADKRCQDFKTCGNHAYELTGTSYVNLQILARLVEGRRNILAGKCDAARKDKERIEQLMAVPLIQGTLRYAYKTDLGNESSEKSEAEGATFAAAVLPVVNACNEDAADAIYNNMKVGQKGSANFTLVKNAFESVYSCMNIRCEDVGGIYDTTTGGYMPQAQPCISNQSSEVAVAVGVSVGGVALIAIITGMVFMLSPRYWGTQHATDVPTKTVDVEEMEESQNVTEDGDEEKMVAA